MVDVVLGVPARDMHVAGFVRILGFLTGELHVGGVVDVFWVVLLYSALVVYLA